MISYGFRLVALTLAFSSAPSMSKENNSANTFDVRSIECKKFLDLKEQSRDYLFFFLYGYSSGVEKDYKHSVKKIEQAVEILGSACSNKPEAKVFDVLKSTNMHKGSK